MLRNAKSKIFVAACAPLLSLTIALPSSAQVITTIAGTTWVFRGDGKPAVEAPLGRISGVAVDSAGNILATDPGNHLVVRVSPSGILTVVAGNGIAGFTGDGGLATAAGLFGPSGVTTDAAGNIYIAEGLSNRVRKVSPSGVITTFAGNGTPGVSGDGGPATAASIRAFGLGCDTAGNVYIVDAANHRVRKVSPSGIITTFAGNGTLGFSGDEGPATAASLNSPGGVAADTAGNIYIADTYNLRIRKVSPSGMITTFAGNGTQGLSGDGGPATAASLWVPSSVASDVAGNVYIGEFNHRVRKVSTSGMITTIAGIREPGFSGDGGPATAALLDSPLGVAVDAAGNVYIADSMNHRVRKVSSSGTIATIAGKEGFKFSGDGGPATVGSLNAPIGGAAYAAGNLYIADTNNSRIRKVSPSGIITTVAGNGIRGFSGDGGLATAASLTEPLGVTTDAAGNIYIADGMSRRIRKVSPSGTITTFAGNGTFGFSGDGGPATAASLFPVGVATDAAGNLYIADSVNSRIRKVSPSGIITTFAGNGTAGFSGDGGPATAASLNVPVGVATDAAGNLYIADNLNNRIRRVSPSGIITTFAGNGTAGFSGDGGPATSASLFGPRSIATDAAGNLYIADNVNSRIRRVNPSGMISTFAGTGGGGISGDGGLATAASVGSPSSVATDPAGNIYALSDDRIRKVLAAPPSFSVSPATLTVSASSGSDILVTRQLAVASEVLGLSWTAQASESWLSVSPGAGTVPGVITVTVDVSTLAPGTYRGTIRVQAPLALPPSQTVTVDLTVTRGLGPQLTVNPGSLIVEVPAGTGNPPPQSLRITNEGGGGALSWTAQGEIFGGGNWLGVLATSGSASVRSPGNIPVRLNVAGLRPGLYSGLVRVSSQAAGQAQDVPVTLLISQQTKTILTTQTAFHFTATEGSRSATSQTMGVFNTGQGTMDWSVQPSTLAGGSWLSTTPNRGQSQAGSPEVNPVTVQVDPSGLPAGSYSGVLRINGVGANNSPYVVTVNSEVSLAAALGVQVRAAQLIFTTPAGVSSPSSQTIRLTTSRNAGVVARSTVVTLDGRSWLQVLPTDLVLSASDPRTVVVQPNVSGLAPGEYRAALSFQFDDGSDPQVVNIFFLVTAGTPLSAASVSGASLSAASACTPQKLLAADRALGSSFTATVGSGTGLEVQLVDDCANPVSEVTVVASFSNGDPPVTLNGVGTGIYTGTWRPLTAAPQAAAMIRVTTPSLPAVEVLAQGRVLANDKAPALFPGGIVSAASFAPGVPLAPGSIVSLFGRNLATTAAASSTPLPRTLGGATLTISNLDVPLFYASNGQMNAQLPFELQGNTRQQAVVKSATTITPPESIAIAPARPGIFTVSQNGKGQGAILSGQGRLVDAGSPAAAGDVVAIYATGMGLTDPPGITGQPAGSQLSAVTTPISATIGGRSAVVHFAGLAPGFVGLYQVNVEIPAGLAAGDAVPLVLSQDGVPSNTVTLAVR